MLGFFALSNIPGFLSLAWVELHWVLNIVSLKHEGLFYCLIVFQSTLFTFCGRTKTSLNELKPIV